MKISVSLRESDVHFLDELAARLGESRSGVIQLAVRRLQASQHGDDYEAAWDEWSESGEAQTWDIAAGDGLSE